YLPGPEIWTYCCTGLFKLPLQGFRVIGSVLPGHKIFEVALVDINRGVGKLSDSTNAKASGVVSMDVGQQNRVDLLRLISCCLEVGNEQPTCGPEQFSGTRVDENQMRTRVDQIRVDGYCH